MTAPFLGQVFTFTQPDGTKIQLKGWGDQHYAVFETLDGYTAIKNPSTGFYEIAQITADGNDLESAATRPGDLDGSHSSVSPGVRINHSAARAKGLAGAQKWGMRRCDQRRLHKVEQMRNNTSRAVAAPPSRGTVGDFQGLCLLIDFSDDERTIEPTEVERFCNEQGYSGYGNQGSVYDYFFDNSIGRCRYTNQVMAYYRAQHPKHYYTDSSINYGDRARELIQEALTHFKNQGVDFSSLSTDDAGFIYAVNVFYAGFVQNNWGEGLWPHAYSLATTIELAPGKWAYDYQVTAMTDELSLGTFCHENGHMLCDYPDLYDYGGESSGVGGYCLMCAGNHVNQKNPTQISAYLKYLAGWASDVKPIEDGATISLNSGNNEFAIYTKNDLEYFILENRAQQGRDSGLSDEGLAIWHVDESGSNNNEQRSPFLHYELSLEQADGNFDLESQRYTYGDQTDLYGRGFKRFADWTIPNSKWWDGTSSKLDIYDISDPGIQMSFKARVEPQVQQRGDLVRYKDFDQNGISEVANLGVAARGDWEQYRFVFSGGNGIIYAVTHDGNLLFFRDSNGDGTGEILQHGIIGYGGWNHFKEVFSGGNGNIYAINHQGDLLFYKDHYQDGSGDVSHPSVIGHGGWNQFKTVFSGGNGVIYAITYSGDLKFYRDDYQDGTGDIAHPSTIGRGGWDTFQSVFSGSHGVIYAITHSGNLLFYRDYYQDGTGDVAFPGTIGFGGWSDFASVFATDNGVIYAAVK